MTTETMSPPEAAELLGVHASTVRRWMDEGVLEGERNPLTGRRTLNRADVERLARNVGQHPASGA